ncbi:invasion associated locus B family protein, partial [Klebsiella variicola]|uniref:invasion associated locus B family protein n=3 Tax=Pseudomonadota TaxID=1224 RepID=UPI0019544BF0
KSTHGAWSIICDTPAGATSEQCVMMQNVVAEDRPEMGLSVVVLRTADNKAEILRVLAPLGVLLPNGLGLNVDGKDIGRAYFVRCFQDGC